MAQKICLTVDDHWRGPAWQKATLCGHREMFDPIPVSPEKAGLETCGDCLFQASLAVSYADRIAAQAECDADGGHSLAKATRRDGTAAQCGHRAPGGLEYQHGVFVCIKCGWSSCESRQEPDATKMRLAAVAVRLLGREKALSDVEAALRY